MERQYKESAIEWIGQIPENWKIERLKYLFSERNERDCKGRTLLSVSQYYGIRPKSETDLADSHIAESYDDYKEVYQGDFVMNIMLAWNGSYAVSDYDGMVSPAYCVFKFRKDCCKKYFHYLLRTDGYPSAFKTMSRVLSIVVCVYIQSNSILFLLSYHLLMSSIVYPTTWT